MPKLLTITTYSDGEEMAEVNDIKSLSDLDIHVQEDRAMFKEFGDTNLRLDYFLECVHTETSHRSFEHVKTEQI